jgi:hypothetical protein
LTGAASAGSAAGVASAGSAAEQPETPAAAAQVVRDYYAAIDARDFARAYRSWSGDGQASGQTLADVEAGFADTSQVQAQVGPPGPIGAAAGSRYVEIPVDVTASTSDGAQQHFQGSLTLRRAVVDGASPEQRQWHISAATVAEVPADASSDVP